MGFGYGNLSIAGGGAITQFWEPNIPGPGTEIINTNRATGGVIAHDDSDPVEQFVANLFRIPAFTPVLAYLTTNGTQMGLLFDKDGAGPGVDILRLLIFDIASTVAGLQATKDFAHLQYDGSGIGGRKFEAEVNEHGFVVRESGVGDGFRIGPGGQIMTNQALTPAAHPVVNFEVPVYSPVGVLLGYMQLFI